VAGVYAPSCCLFEPGLARTYASSYHLFCNGFGGRQISGHFRIGYPAYAHSVELLRYLDQQFLDYDLASMLVDIVIVSYPLE
jgi:hypothetical protein